MTDVDITQDLSDGSDGGLSDTRPVNAAMPNTELLTPPGTQPVFGQNAKQVNTVEQPVKQQELSLRDQLSSAFKDDSNKPTDQQNAQNVQPTNAPTEPSATLTQDGDGRWHNADGSFASQDQVNAFVNANLHQGQQAEPQFLTGMTPVEQQQFKSLPAELQQYVGKTMEGLNNQAQRLNEYDLIEQQIIGPRRNALSQNGFTPATALNQLFALSDFASRDPGSFVLWMAQQHNLDLDAMLDARDAQQQSNDPNVVALQQTIQGLQTQVNGFFQQQQQQAHTANLDIVQQFSAEKDETGTFKRPYVTDVMNEWGSHVSALRQSNPQMRPQELLQRAYDAACWGNPQVRAKMQAAVATNNRQEEATKVQRATAAGSSINGAPQTASGQPNNTSRNLREELEHQFHQSAM